MSIERIRRREFLVRGGLASMTFLLNSSLPLAAEDLHTLNLACAGSFRPMAEGPLQSAAQKALRLSLKVHAQGADAVAHDLVQGSLRADVFLPITATPMLTVMRAGLASTALPMARTEMVLVYSPASPYAEQLAAASGETAWWQVLQQPGLRFGRSDPRADPGGRNIIFALMLAAEKYGQADLVQRVLGAALNPLQVSVAGNALQQLQQGKLDVSVSYKVSAEAAHLPYVELPADINLGGLTVHAQHPEIHLTLEGQRYTPEPLVFYAAVLQNTSNAAGAKALLQWLQQGEAQALLQANGYAPVGEAQALSL